jgi:membrane-bound metal-dependent hydrolase YbcI (DUF457 family)
MPNKSTHRKAGAISGTFLAAVRASGQRDESVVLESLGGCIGGVVGGGLPDWLEPATWPGHRSFFHSLTAGGVAYKTVSEALNEWESYCREKAVLARTNADLVDADGWQRLGYWIQQLLWQIAAGLLSGLLAGYGSHLALDMVTPASLPFIA